MRNDKRVHNAELTRAARTLNNTAMLPGVALNDGLYTSKICLRKNSLYKSKKNTKKLNPKNMIQDIAIKCVQNAGKENPQREENKLDVPMGRGRLFVLIVVVYNAELTGKPPCGEP